MTLNPIQRMEMMGLTSDIANLIAALATRGVVADPERAYLAWSKHSASTAGCWMPVMPLPDMSATGIDEIRDVYSRHEDLIGRRHAMYAVARDGKRHMPHLGAARFVYGPWIIERASGHHPDSSSNWEWHHEDCTTADDARCGTATSVKACVGAIHEVEDASGHMDEPTEDYVRGAPYQEALLRAITGTESRTEEDWKESLARVVDHLKEDPTQDADGPTGGYVHAAPYLEMRLRMAITGRANSTEDEWTSALKLLLEHLKEHPLAIRPI